MSVRTALKLRQGQTKRRLRTAARMRRQKKQRQRMFATAAAAVFALGAIPLSYATFTGTDLVIPGTEAARSFLALMSDRSPGERTHAEVSKGKPAAAPRQRALGKVREPEPPKTFIEAIAPPLPTIEELPLKPLALASPEIPGLFISSPPPGGGIFVPPGGGGPPPGQPEQPEQPEEPEQPEPPVPPIPEPSTWAMMLLGFGLTGVMMRRRRRTATPIPA